MSNICLTYTWGKHESISVEIYAEDAFPDAYDPNSCSTATSSPAATATARRYPTSG